MQDLTEKITKLTHSLYRLRALNVNVPSIIYSAADPRDESIRSRNMATVAAITKVMRPSVKVVIPERVGNAPLEDSELKEFLKEYDGGALLVLRAPKTKILAEAEVTPGPYQFKIHIDGVTDSFFWGFAKADFGEHYKRMFELINTQIQRVRMELDGCRMRVTYHERGEGEFGDRILLWGNCE